MLLLINPGLRILNSDWPVAIGPIVLISFGRSQSRGSRGILFEFNTYEKHFKILFYSEKSLFKCHYVRVCSYYIRFY